MKNHELKRELLTRLERRYGKTVDLDPGMHQLLREGFNLILNDPASAVDFCVRQLGIIQNPHEWRCYHLGLLAGLAEYAYFSSMTPAQFESYMIPIEEGFRRYKRQIQGEKKND